MSCLLLENQSLALYCQCTVKGHLSLNNRGAKLRHSGLNGSSIWVYKAHVRSVWCPTVAAHKDTEGLAAYFRPLPISTLLWHLCCTLVL